MARLRRDDQPPAITQPRVGNIWVLGLVVVLFLPLLFCAWYGFRETWRQTEFAQAGDAFGYLEMAKDLRLGAAPHGLPRFTADSQHARLLLDFLRQQHLPLDQNGFVGPNEYHYQAAIDRIICQYPPGTAAMLNLLPEGRAVFTWQMAVLGLVMVMAIWTCTRALRRQTAEAVAAAGFTCLLAQCVMLLLGLAISFSVDLSFVPLLIAVGAVFLARERTGRAGYLLASLAGAALGWTMVVRVAAVLFLPGFLPLLVTGGTARSRSLRTALFALAFTAAGIVPLLIYQHVMTGSAFHSTYTPIDTAGPTLDAVLHNVAHYFFWGGGGNGMFISLEAGLLAFILWIIAAAQKSLPASMKHIWIGSTAIALWLLIPTAYFLLHPVATQYYQFPTWVICLAGTAWTALRAARHNHPTSSETPPRTSPIWMWLVPLLTAGAIVYIVTMLPPLGDDKPFSLPDTTLPASLEDPHAWVIGDRLVGTLWYYHGLLGHQILQLDAPTRLAFYHFIQTRNEPLYALADNQAMNPIFAELAAHGARLTEAGTFAGVKVVRVNWP